MTRTTEIARANCFDMGGYHPPSVEGFCYLVRGATGQAIKLKQIRTRLITCYHYEEPKIIPTTSGLGIESPQCKLTRVKATSTDVGAGLNVKGKGHIREASTVKGGKLRSLTRKADYVTPLTVSMTRYGPQWPTCCRAEFAVMPRRSPRGNHCYDGLWHGNVRPWSKRHDGESRIPSGTYEAPQKG